MFAHGVRPRDDGGARIRISPRERDVLATLPEQLAELLRAEAPDGPAAAIRDRLFPRAYEEPEAEAEYREMVGDDPVAERLDAVAVFARTLDAGSTGRRGWSVDLSAEEASAWLSTVNDARLCLGIITGVDDDLGWEGGPDHSDPASVLLYYLGWLQEELVGALAAGLGGG